MTTPDFSHEGEPRPEDFMANLLASAACEYLLSANAEDHRRQARIINAFGAEIEVEEKGVLEVSDATFRASAQSKLGRLFSQHGLIPPSIDEL